MSGIKRKFNDLLEISPFCRWVKPHPLVGVGPDFIDLISIRAGKRAQGASGTIKVVCQLLE